MLAAQRFLARQSCLSATPEYYNMLFHHRHLLKKEMRGTVPSEAHLRTLAILDATIALREAYRVWGCDELEDTPETRAPVMRALRTARAVYAGETPATGLYDHIIRRFECEESALGEEEESPPPSSVCPRHFPGAAFQRSIRHAGVYAQGTPGCRGGDCILGLCDHIRETLFCETYWRSTTVDLAISLKEHIQEALEPLPPGETAPEATRVLAILSATIDLQRAYRTWKAAGEDTPLTREPLELALRAVETVHDLYTPYTEYYRWVCRRLVRLVVLPSEVEPTG